MYLNYYKMAFANYVLPILLASLIFLIYDTKCAEHNVASRNRDFLLRLQQENVSNLPTKTTTTTTIKPQTSSSLSYAAIASKQQNNKPVSLQTILNPPKVPQRQQPQPWPLPPQNPQSILRPISGNKITKTTTPKNEEDDELREFSENLLLKETNNPMGTIRVNYQGRTSSRSTVDEAPMPLITISNETNKFLTVQRLRSLYDNYVLNQMEDEYVTPIERQEEELLLDAMLNTQVMKFAREFLVSKGKLSKNPEEFRDYLKQIWFGTYSRGSGRVGSSGFEHVFLSEKKGNNQVLGLHNWIYFQDQEKKGNVNYLGYMNKLEFGTKGAILKFHATIHNIDKPVNSIFIGTTPEFEMALMTTCFALRANNICPLQLDGKKFIIRTYNFKYRGKDLIGSAFPEI